VRFDSNVSGGLPWRFEPEAPSIQVRLGEVVTFNYLVTNLSARETHGVAAYNVTPLNMGAYFQKINCFCFNEQTLKPGEKREMAVVFYVDPALEQDTDGPGLNSITLSYTFYPQRDPRPAAPDARAERPGTPKL
jgi:cytochrome c oxidase assembly protein subunit 11